MKFVVVEPLFPTDKPNTGAALAMSFHPAEWFPSAVCGYSFAAAFLAWYVTESLYPRLGRDPRRKTKDRGSRRVAMLSVHSGIAAGILLRVLGWGDVSPLIQYGGVAIMVLGMFLRAWAIHVLGRHFSVHVAMQPEHRLITTGPYRWVRHPSYTGTLLTVMGVPLAIGIGPLSPLVGILFVVGHSYRIRIEEAMMAELFGTDYESYCRSTWRLFPGW